MTGKAPGILSALLLILPARAPLSAQSETLADSTTELTTPPCRQRAGFMSQVFVPGVLPTEIIRWLSDMTLAEFRAWHPEHKEYAIIKRTPGWEGSRIYFLETIDGFSIRGKWRIVSADSSQGFVAKRIGLPVFWSMILKPDEQQDLAGTLVRNEKCYGTGIALLDRLLIGLVHRWYLTEDVRRAINRHDREEFLQLGRIIRAEKASPYII